MPEQEIPKKLGRYEIVRELGKGAMGIVYEGRDPNIGRRVAIKTARRDAMEKSGRTQEMMERFLREARAAGNLSHPNIVTIYDAGEENDTAFIAMEFLEGPDLQKVRKTRMFGPEEVVELGATICEALAHAHDKGIVHRDVKPANIILMEDGTIKVADFGIARVEDSTLTQEGAMIGTPHYMSPEQFRGQKVDPRSDLFSVAVILYELLTNERPFHGDQISTVMHSVCNVDPQPAKSLNPAVDDCLSAVIQKALNKNPRQRYPNGRAMAAALRESIKENPNPSITLIPVSAADSMAATAAMGNSMAETVAAPVSPGVQETVASGPGFATAVTPGPETETPVPPTHVTRMEGAAVTPAKPGMNKGLVLGGAAAAAVLVIAGGVFALMGGGTKVNGRGAVSGPSWGTLELTVWEGSREDLKTYVGLAEPTQDFRKEDCIACKLFEGDDLQVQVTDGASNTRVETVVKKLDPGSFEVALDPPVRELKVSLSAPGYESPGEMISMMAPNQERQTKTLTFVLARKVDG